MAIKDLLAMSASQLSALEGAELRRAFKSVSASLRMRRQAFARHDKLSGMPEKYRGGIRKAGSFDTEAEMRDYMKTGLAYMKGRVSTFSGYQESISEKRKAIEAKRGKPFKSNEEFERWGDFLAEMQERNKMSWHSISDVVQSELWDESERLNIDPMQLMKNFEYWSEHLEDLKKAKPLKRGRELRASDYLKALKLENISTYYANEIDELMRNKKLSKEMAKEEAHKYSSTSRKPSRGRKAKQGRKGK